MYAVLLVTMVILGMNVHGQAWSSDELKHLVIGCHDRPSPAASGVSLAVDKAWIENASLFADLLITNGLKSAIRLPRRNVCQRYWGSRVDPIRDERIALCAGELLPNDCNVLGMFGGHPLEALLAEEDIETVAPGRTALLRAVYLGPFVADMRDREHAVRSFEVIYMGLSEIEVSILPEKLARHETALAEASARQCSLYNGVVRSRGQFLDPGDVQDEKLPIVIPR